MTVTASGTVTATFIPNVVVTASPASITIAHGSTGAETVTIKGAPQSVTMSYTSTNVGITVTFATNPVTDSVAGVNDIATVHVASTVAAGTYHVTITGTGADGIKSSYTVTVHVT
jgi:hypothetical protein